MLKFFAHLNLIEHYPVVAEATVSQAYLNLFAFIRHEALANLLPY